jgi:hypothetical protein
MGHGRGQGFDILPRDGLGRDFDTLSRPVPEKTGQQRDKREKRVKKNEKKIEKKFIIRLSSSDKGKSMKMKR